MVRLGRRALDLSPQILLLSVQTIDLGGDRRELLTVPDSILEIVLSLGQILEAAVELFNVPVEPFLSRVVVALRRVDPGEFPDHVGLADHVLRAGLSKPERAPTVLLSGRARLSEIVETSAHGHGVLVEKEHVGIVGPPVGRGPNGNQDRDSRECQRREADGMAHVQIEPPVAPMLTEPPDVCT